MPVYFRSSNKCFIYIGSWHSDVYLSTCLVSQNISKHLKGQLVGKRFKTHTHTHIHTHTHTKQYFFFSQKMYENHDKIVKNRLKIPEASNNLSRPQNIRMSRFLSWHIFVPEVGNRLRLSADHAFCDKKFLFWLPINLFSAISF